MAAAKLDAMDLEAMRKEDSSWHPCCISLSSSDPIVGIIVDFGKGDDEDVICNKEDALLRLRFRSTPLHGDECSNVKEGDRVLALQKTQFKSFFVEAIIEEPKRVKHSKRVHCRCTFEIKWLNSELKGETIVVPSKSILKFSDRSIDEHPVFSSFLKALSSENGRKSPSLPSFSEESSYEADFVGVLEKQVEEISKLVDGSISSFADLFLEVKSANAMKQKQRPLSRMKLSTNRQFSTKRTTRSQKNNQIETEVTKETDLKPVLSPLAARAALASLLVHELPEKSYPGGDYFIKHGDSQQSDATEISELSATDAISSSVKSTFNLHNQVLLSSNPSDSTNDYTKFSNPLLTFSNSRNADVKMKSHGSTDIMSVTHEKALKTSSDKRPIIHQNLRSSVNGEKTEISSSTRRLTRSMLKESEALKPKTSANKEVIASTVVIDKVYELVEEFTSDEDDVEEVALSKKLVGSTNESGCINSTMQREKGTCSSCLPLEELVTPDNYEMKKKKSISTHVDSKAETDSTTEGNEHTTKRRTRFSPENHLGTYVEHEENHKAAKKVHVSLKKASTALPLRSSPRLACLPKTLSEAKS